ncbi:clarin-3 isoform X2 [Sparus aurata]|uniref:clarin-3 isoform X2 n=1 Tax=Sparus aurata TaxID=8175 RepID=UPI0011C0FC1B|nr:clarin-3 isoform X2 [Sparus aurata]
MSWFFSSDRENTLGFISTAARDRCSQQLSHCMRCHEAGRPRGRVGGLIPTLANIGGVNIVLHALAVLLLVLCLLFSALSILISLYNSVSNPYETYMGPIGIYVCSSLSACLSFLVLILFVVNVQATDLTEKLVKNLANELEVKVRDESSQMQFGYYLVIPYTVLSLVAILLIYLYDHAAYTQRKEQQRPTEDAPKEIMMY